MSTQGRNTINDTEFEAQLQNSLSELPPEDVVNDVTPWKKSINRALAGLALTVVVLNFWYLDYLLPAIGTILMLLGFRALRKENKWFGSCYVISIFQGIYFFFTLILNTTIVCNIWNTPEIETVLIDVNLLLRLFEFVCLWRGFLAVQKKAGILPHAGGAIALIVWYALMCLLAFLQYSGWIIVGLMLVSYVFILRNLYKLSGELDEAGYAISAAPVRLTDRCFVSSIVVLILLGGASGYLFGNSYPMIWSVQNASEHQEVKEVKEQLISLGFPESVLNDLTTEEIETYQGASRIIVDTSNGSFDDGGGLQITGIGVQISEKRWIILHYFLWTTAPEFYGTESIQLWPVYRDIPEGWESVSDVTGRVLYDRDDTTFVADYYSISNQTVSSASVFWDTRSYTDVFAAFSLPRNGSNYRGYVMYSVDEMGEGYYISSWLNYTHQRSWLQYPVKTAMETRMLNSGNDAGAFQTIQDALQFDPTGDTIEK